MKVRGRTASGGAVDARWTFNPSTPVNGIPLDSFVRRLKSTDRAIEPVHWQWRTVRKTAQVKLKDGRVALVHYEDKKWRIEWAAEEKTDAVVREVDRAKT